ncbi:MAG: hypothetical protein WC441_04870 [Patescibacteria group bacterium]
MKKLILLLFLITFLVSGVWGDRVKIRKLPDYVVTGSLTPDATGNYYYTGIVNGKPYYRRGIDSWFIWRSEVNNTWWITTTLASISGYRWTRVNTEIVGSYVAEGGATGTATVTAYGD